MEDHIQKPKTIICDLDGTLFRYHENFADVLFQETLEVKTGAAEKLVKAHCLGYYIVLFTGRPESSRALTKRQLENAGIPYDQLIMGIGTGERVLINDRSDSGSNKAWAINVDRKNPEFLDGADWF